VSRNISESSDRPPPAEDGATAAVARPDETSGTATGGRRLALDVHARLRAMILSGELPPGSVLLQAEMARKLQVSRTPMREAFRLLQEEGLIDARPDQRARVKAVDPEDLDGAYGARIMLETLAVSVTARSLSPEDVEHMSRTLQRMQELTGDEWYAAHREFHRIATQGVGTHLQRMLASLTEHSERYVRLARLGIPSSFARAHEDHEALLETLRENDPAEAASVIARHLARTALNLLADVAPEYEPVATRTALGITGGGHARVVPPAT
jgi:DNA-binding GntR family transcriptional regulator